MIFQWEFYLYKYNDLQINGLLYEEDAYQHWINYGKKEQIELWDNFGGIKKITEDFIKFVNLSNEMNDNEFCIHQEYYNKVCDYIQEKHKHQLFMFTPREMKKYLNK